MTRIITLRKAPAPGNDVFVNVDHIAYFNAHLSGDELGTEVHFVAASAQRLASIVVLERPTDVLAMIKSAGS